MSISTEWKHWLIDAGNLEPGGNLRIFNVPSGLTHRQRVAEMKAAVKAAYPSLDLEPYWHGGFSVYRNR